MKKPIQTSIIMAFGLLATGIVCVTPAWSGWQSVCPDFVFFEPRSNRGLA